MRFSQDLRAMYVSFAKVIRPRAVRREDAPFPWQLLYPAPPSGAACVTEGCTTCAAWAALRSATLTRAMVTWLC